MVTFIGSSIHLLPILLVYLIKNVTPGCSWMQPFLLRSTFHRTQKWDLTADCMHFSVSSAQSPILNSFPSSFSQFLSTAANQRTLHWTTQFSTEWECSQDTERTFPLTKAFSDSLKGVFHICVLSIKIGNKHLVWDVWEGVHVDQAKHLLMDNSKCASAFLSSAYVQKYFFHFKVYFQWDMSYEPKKIELQCHNILGKGFYSCFYVIQSKEIVSW